MNGELLNRLCAASPGFRELFETVPDRIPFRKSFSHQQATLFGHHLVIELDVTGTVPTEALEFWEHLHHGDDEDQTLATVCIPDGLVAEAKARGIDIERFHNLCGTKTWTQLKKYLHCLG